MKDLIELADLKPEQLRGLLRLAQQLRAQPDDTSDLLAGKVLAMLFMKPSLRTRVSFDVGMRQLGGDALYLSPAEVGLGERESTADVARVLSRYVGGIMARVFGHQDVVDLARNASVPVLNGLSDAAHPCQVLADLLTILDLQGGLSGVRLTYIGDGNNVAQSLMVGGALAGMQVTVVHPPGYAPSRDVLSEAQRIATATSARVDVTTELDGANGADVLYTDVWASMGQEAEARERTRVFASYQLDAGVLARASKDAIVLHCLPAHRGEEIAAEVIDGPASRVFDQAENRLHAQKAALAWLLGGLALPL